MSGIFILSVLLILLPLIWGKAYGRLFCISEKGIFSSYIVGIVLLFALFELTYTPYVLMEKSFFKLSELVSLEIFTVSILSVIYLFIKEFRKRRNTTEQKDVKDLFMEWKQKTDFSKDSKILLIFALVLFFYQIYMAVFYQYLDGDDAYYVAQSLAARETGKMYLLLPYTGGTTVLDVRHALAGITIFYSYLSQLSGIHPTIIAHTIMPVFLIGVTYLVFYKIGRRLFDEKENRNRPLLFLCTVQLLVLFGNSTIFTNETFFLTRTWQGKAIMASFVLAFEFHLLQILQEKLSENRATKREGMGFWILLGALGIAGVFCTTLGVYLIPLFWGTGIIFLFLRTKKISLILNSALAMIPCIGYSLLYLLY